ncbi:MAG: AmmeMemoRadiSam system protein B [Actinobacteria bacterium]|nr:AmmeMemoRadiSam system protein B [Actinomycetota bacterium]
MRPPAVAGAFYPADPAALRREVQEMLAAASPVEAAAPLALIVPHAGYDYSGPVAATAYSHLARTRTEVRRVLLVGPSHFARFEGLALPGVDALATPLGEVAVDAPGEARALGHPGVARSPAAHAREHSLEVQLPFLQVALGGPPVTALLCAGASPDQVAPVIEEFLGEEDAVVLVSSDLSHYLPYEEARRRDEATAQAIERLDPDALDHQSACGLVGMQALLLAARSRGLAATRLDLRNSGDTAGDRSRVVGYGAFAFA